MDFPKAVIAEALISFFGKDYRRIEYALSVLYHSLRIAESKNGVDFDVLISVALLHDVGIKPAESIHGYT